MNQHTKNMLNHLLTNGQLVGPVGYQVPAANVGTDLDGYFKNYQVYVKPPPVMKVHTRAVLDNIVNGVPVYRNGEQLDQSAVNALDEWASYYQLEGPELVSHVVAEKVAPPMGTAYYSANLRSPANFVGDRWKGSDYDKRLLSHGLVHLTPENAVRHAKNLILRSGGKLVSE